MRTSRILVLALVFIIGNALSAQRDTLINDTLWIYPSATRPIEFSKAFGKVVCIKGIVPEDLNPKLRKIQFISSIANEIEEKKIMVINKTDIAVPFNLFTDRYYTLYIKKSNATIFNKKVIIR
jgi:hypothetical protein